MASNADVRKRFKAALALSGTTQAAFADQNDVTAHHLAKVLRGERPSLRLQAAIDAFIAASITSIGAQESAASAA